MSLQFRAPGIEQYLDTRPMNLAGAFTSGYGQAQNKRAVDLRRDAMKQAELERKQAREESIQIRYGPDLVLNPETGQPDFGASEAARMRRQAIERARESGQFGMGDIVYDPQGNVDWGATEAKRDQRAIDEEQAKRDRDFADWQRRQIIGEALKPEPKPPAERAPDRPFEGTRERDGGKQTGKFATQEELDAWMNAGGGQQAFGLDEWQRARNVIEAAEVADGKVKVVVDPDTGEVSVTEAGWFGLGGMTPADARKRIEELRRRRDGGLTPPAPEAATGTNRPVRRFDYRALQMLPSGQ